MSPTNRAIDVMKFQNSFIVKINIIWSCYFGSIRGFTFFSGVGGQRIFGGPLILFPKFWGATKNIPEISGGDFFSRVLRGTRIIFRPHIKKTQTRFHALSFISACHLMLTFPFNPGFFLGFLDYTGAPAKVRGVLSNVHRKLSNYILFTFLVPIRPMDPQFSHFHIFRIYLFTVKFSSTVVKVQPPQTSHLRAFKK